MSIAEYYRKTIKNVLISFEGWAELVAVKANISIYFLTQYETSS